MANVSLRPDTRSNADRGQLILVTGFAIAVVLLALVLLLNTAIYTENIATRSTTDDTREAVEIHATVESSIGSYIDRKNEAIANDSSSHSLTDVESEVAAVSAPHEERSLRHGQILSIEYGGQTDGTKIASVDEGNITSTADPVEFLTNATNTRAFEVTLTSLPEENNKTQILITDAETGSITEIDLYQDDTGAFVVASEDETCTTTAADPVFALSDGQFGDQPCGVRWPAVTTHSISIVNGSATTGELSLVTHGAEEVTTDDERLTESDAVYNINASVVYVTDRLEYSTELRIAPGEPDV